MFKKLKVNTLCLYEKYLFIKVKFEEKISDGLSWFSYKKQDKNNMPVTISDKILLTFTYEDDWNHKNIK